ncbi:unnamed protein product [Moneuplotes crassus]|uniref:Phosphatidylinositol-4-phosphate 5-kinase n=1 Tax=Euplotes crassus TaxID=5936 RepID=A0AAD1Y5V9_EUPCR|nr:unnamed protein product [Moneuplotes crassus]
MDNSLGKQSNLKAPQYYKSLIKKSKILSKAYKMTESKVKKSYRHNKSMSDHKNGRKFHYRLNLQTKINLNSNFNATSKVKMTNKAIPIFNEYENMSKSFEITQKKPPRAELSFDENPQASKNKQDFYNILMQIKQNKNRSGASNRLENWFENARKVLDSRRNSKKRRSLTSNRCYTASQRTRQLSTNSFENSFNYLDNNVYTSKSHNKARRPTTQMKNRFNSNGFQSYHMKPLTSHNLDNSLTFINFQTKCYDSAIKKMTNTKLFTEPEWEDFNLKASPKKKPKEIMEKLKRKYKHIKKSYPDVMPKYVDSQIAQFLKDLHIWFGDLFKAGTYHPNASLSKVNFMVSEKGDIFISTESSNEATGEMIVLKQHYIAKGRFIKGIIQGGQASIFYNTGDYYEGKILHGGTPDGQGSYYYEDGKNYDGQFVEGKRIGKGRLNYPNRGQYIGQFIEDDANGNGIFTDFEGNRYMSLEAQSYSEQHGNFKKGRLYGMGEIRYENSNIYKGNFKNSKKDGYGIMLYSVPTETESRTGTYKGQWKRDMREGEGEMSYDNMSIFKGNWAKDAKSYGTLLNNDSSKYIGNFYNEEYNGYGKLILANGTVIEGEFNNGELKEKGKITFPDNKIFEGVIEDNDIGDRGVLYFPDGNQYEGQFKFGRQHGFGILTCKNGDKYEGKWDEGTKTGFGREFIAQTKEYYEGEFDKDFREGNGKLLTEGGELYEITSMRGELKNRSMLPIRVGSSLYKKQVSKFLEERHIVEPKVTVNHRNAVCVTIMP